MNKQELIHQLYENYRDVTNEYDASIEALPDALRTNRATQVILERATEQLSALEANVILGEIHSDGRINGKNAETRQRQTTLLLAEFHVQDAAAKSLVNDIKLAHQTLNDCNTTIETIKVQFYRHQVVARMIAGLATALGGQL